MSETNATAVLINNSRLEKLPEGRVGKKELARLLDIGVRTIERLMAERGIPFYKLHRRVVFIYWEVEEALRERFRKG